jgi:hypothetical protein
VRSCRVDAVAQLVFGPLVTRLARAIDVEQRAPYVVVADLEGPLPHVRHVAVGTGHAAAAVHALVPHLELGVLRLQHRRAGIRVRPVLEAGLLIVGHDVLNLQTLRPGVREALLRALEVVLDVALPADERAHLLPRRLRIHVVVLQALGRLERANSLHEARPRDPELHRLRVVAIDAGDRVRHELARLHVRRPVHQVEPLHQIAAAKLPVRHPDGRVALHAGAGLLHDLLAFGEGLIVQHVGVAPLLAEVL